MRCLVGQRQFCNFTVVFAAVCRREGEAPSEPRGAKKLNHPHGADGAFPSQHRFHSSKVALSN